MRDMVLALVSAFFLLMFLLMSQGCEEVPRGCSGAPSAPLPRTRNTLHGYSPCCWSPVQLALLEQEKV